MKLFRRQNTVTDVPPELQPYYSGNTRSGAHWSRLVLVIASIVVLVGLLVAGGIWLANRHDEHKKPAPKSPSTSTSNNPVNQSPQQGNNNSGAPAQTPASGSTNNGAVTPPASTPAPSNTLPNTGG